jgi:hypothetical protein
MTMKNRPSISVLILAGLVPAASLTSFAADNSSTGWNTDFSLYGLAAGMTGDVTVHGVKADVDVGFNTILDNLKMGAMGRFRVSNGPWAVTADIIYMSLGASKGGVSANLDQWVVEPTVSYRLTENVEVLAGTRYNSISGDISGPGILPTPRIATGAQDWFDPIMGAKISLPFARTWSFDFRGDIGGNSGLTWQAFPAMTWRFSSSGSVQAGYRWVYTDYKTGNGTNLFEYNVTTEGPQIGVIFRF